MSDQPMERKKPDFRFTQIAIILSLAGFAIMSMYIYEWLVKGLYLGLIVIAAGGFLLFSGVQMLTGNDTERRRIQLYIAFVAAFSVSHVIFSHQYPQIYAFSILVISIFILGTFEKRNTQVLMLVVVIVATGILIGIGFTNLPGMIPAPSELDMFWLWMILITLGTIAGLQILRFRDLTMRIKLTIAFLAISVIPLVALTFLQLNSIQKGLVTDAEKLLEQYSSEAALVLDNFVNQNGELIASQAQNPTVIDYLSLSPAEREENTELTLLVRSNLRSMHSRNAELIYSYGLLDLNGINVMDTIAPLIGEDESRWDYFTEPLNSGELFISDVVFGVRESEFNAIYFSYPIRTNFGETIGVLRVRFDASVVHREVVYSEIGKDQGITLSMYEELAGNYIQIGSNFADITLYNPLVDFEPEQEINLQLQRRLPLNIQQSGEGRDYSALFNNLTLIKQVPIFTFTSDEDGSLYYGAGENLTSKDNWLVIAYQEEEAFLKTANDQFNISLLFLAMIAIIITIIAVLVGDSFSRPITSLTDTARLVQAGDFQARSSVEGTDEIGILAKTFNMVADELSGMINSLEKTVIERTATIEHRARQLQAALEVGRASTETGDFENMLTTITHRISEFFNFYHVGIFLIDDNNEFAVLRATNSEGGWRMLARQHKLAVGQQGVVGYVTQFGKPRVVQEDIELDDIHFQNPDLPFTRSELALPLTVNNEILGALDVQSTEDNAFSEEDITVFQVLADQVALAVYNARLLYQLRVTIAEERRAVGEMTLQSWSQFLHSRETIGYRSTRKGIRRIEAGNNFEEDYELEEKITIPIRIRGQMIGLLEASKPEESFEWGVTEREVLDSIAEQVGIALENARLFEETQSQAQQDRIASEITSKIWASTDIEDILKTTIQELGQTLNISTGRIKLKPKEDEE